MALLVELHHLALMSLLWEEAAALVTLQIHLMLPMGVLAELAVPAQLLQSKALLELVVI